MPHLASAELHTPDELLAGAEALLATNESQFMRSSVLEAMVALESYVHDTVFALLEKRMDPLFVKWLEDKTKMDFDSRLQHITPLALETSIDVSSVLWMKYKEAKLIRNKVAHTGQIVTRQEALQVINTARDWLAYLGSTVEVDLSLLGLKKFIESTTGSRDLTEEEAVDRVRLFYSKTHSMTSIDSEVVIQSMRADMVLSFDDYKVIFEIKRSNDKVEYGLAQLERMYSKLPDNSKYRLVLLIFTDQGIPKTYEAITRINETTSVVFIKVRHRLVSRP